MASSSPDQSPFERNLRLLEKRTGLRITVSDLRGVCRLIPDLTVSAELHNHRCTFCEAVKASTPHRTECQRCKITSTHRAIRGREPGTAICKFGVTEHVEALEIDGVVVAVFYLGQAVGKETERAATRRMEKGTADHPKSATVRRAFSRLPRRTRAEYRSAADQLRAIAEMAGAVIRAEGLPIHELREHLTGIEWARLKPLPPLVRRALIRLERMACRDMSVNRIADELGCGREHLSRLFYKSLQMHLSYWIRRHKLERAQHLLTHSNLSIGEIAYECGFSDQSHFGRTFHSATGTTPFKWRNENRPPRDTTEPNGASAGG